ncbi:MAG: coproporphyrinogen-III oxidase family protein [Candidatus Aminicenantes bacterium]|nr:coproporphyrinogen-III oxidase family protein [Candidatus Aminicenantes bacterium]
MKSSKAGLYVHFPFCRRKCPYCHFYSIPVEPAVDRSRIGLWREGILAEAGRVASGPGFETGGSSLEFETLYIGGGTPSLAAPDDIARLRDDLADRLPLWPVEFTLEANPSDGANDDVFRGWIRAGVTRLSVGAQSFDDGVLRILGRSSTAARTEAFLRRARDAGVASLGVDLMAGIPGETPCSWDRTIEAVRTLRPDHVSLYFLENVEGLPFERTLRANPVDDDAAVDAFERAAGAFSSLGLRRYEISNFARPGRECLHNLKYWRYEPFLGLGPSAASHLGAKRWTNIADFGKWREGAAGSVPAAETVNLDPDTAAREALAAGLRLVEGIDLESFAGRFGFDPADRFRPEIAGLEDEGLIVLSGRVLRIPENKLLISNSILSRLLR